jgi:GNAT superfamily N-acetyltransferase
MTVVIRRLVENDLPCAEHLVRLAFGTHLGLADPITFAPGRTQTSRFFTAPDGVFGATVDNELIGTVYCVAWGSFGLFGPLAVRPDYWGMGIAQRLLEPAMEYLLQKQVSHAGLFTFADSSKHLALYQKFGYWPRFLTTIMSKSSEPDGNEDRLDKFSALNVPEQAQMITNMKELTNSIYEGLDLGKEVTTAQQRKIGDTILIFRQSKLAGFAICHFGEGSEAGNDTCYVKFAAVRGGLHAPQVFQDLLKQCSSLTQTLGLSQLVAGVNTNRHEAYRLMLAYGFNPCAIGLSMHKPNEDGYDKPGVFVIDDWR